MEKTESTLIHFDTTQFNGVIDDQLEIKQFNDIHSLREYVNEVLASTLYRRIMDAIVSKYHSAYWQQPEIPIEMYVHEIVVDGFTYELFSIMVCHEDNILHLLEQMYAEDRDYVMHEYLNYKRNND